MFDRLTDDGRRAMALAREAAACRGQQAIEPAHLLLGALGEPEGAAATRLGRAGLSPQRLSEAVEQRLPSVSGMVTADRLPFTSQSKAALERAVEEARSRRDAELDGAHLLLGAIDVADTTVDAALEALGLSRSDLVAAASGHGGRDASDASGRSDPRP